MNGPSNRNLRRAALGLAAVVLLMAGLVARIYQAGTAAMARSDRAFDAGKLQDATSAARLAATWYLPGAPHVSAAHRRLRAIAFGAEASGDTDTALRAWGALRAALTETSHPWSDTRDEFAEASQGVARLLVAERNRAAPVLGAEDAARDAELFKTYAEPARGGRALFSILTTVGMALMIGFGLRLASGRRYASSASSFVVRMGLAVGLGLWVLAALGA